MSAIGKLVRFATGKLRRTLSGKRVRLATEGGVEDCGCCDRCDCTSLITPPTYRLLLPAPTGLTGYACSYCSNVGQGTDPVYVSVTGAPADIDVCLTDRVDPLPAGVVRWLVGTVPASVLLEIWSTAFGGGCGRPPDIYSADTFDVSLVFRDDGSYAAEVTVKMIPRPELAGAVRAEAYYFRALGMVGDLDLPDAWCRDGYDVAGKEPDAYDPTGVNTLDCLPEDPGQNWITLGGGTARLVPCCRYPTEPMMMALSTSRGPSFADAANDDAVEVERRRAKSGGCCGSPSNA